MCNGLIVAAIVGWFVSHMDVFESKTQRHDLLEKRFKKQSQNFLGSIIVIDASIIIIYIYIFFTFFYYYYF